MPTPLSTRPRRHLIAWLAAMLLVAMALPVSADAPGNNGTVKIHSGATPGADTHPEVANEPHVTCPIHAHFFFGDAAEPGNPNGPDWWIEPWPGTNAGTGASGEFFSLGGGEYWSGTIADLGTSETAHFKLFWQGQKNIKHKVFWATGCGGGGGIGG